MTARARGYPPSRRPLPTAEWTDRGMNPLADQPQRPTSGGHRRPRAGRYRAGARASRRRSRGRGAARPRRAPGGLRRHPALRARWRDRRGRRGRDGRRAPRGPHERRHAAVRAGARRRRGVRAPSASDRRSPGCALRGRGRGGCRIDPRGPRLCQRARRAARHDAVRDRRRGPRRVPRRRIGGLELPGHARGRGRDDRRRRRARARARRARCLLRSFARPSRTSPSWDPRRRSPAPWPAATTRRSPTQRAAVEEVAPELLDLFDELVRRTRDLAAQRATA